MPTVPCGTRYDGGINDIAAYLIKERPVKWLEELSKLEGMDQAGHNYRNVAKKDWPVKFRMINRDTVLPRQVRVWSFRCKIF